MALLPLACGCSRSSRETTVIPAITYEWLPRGETHAGVVLLLRDELGKQRSVRPRSWLPHVVPFTDADPDVNAGPRVSQRAG